MLIAACTPYDISMQSPLVPIQSAVNSVRKREVYVRIRIKKKRCLKDRGKYVGKRREKDKIRKE